MPSPVVIPVWGKPLKTFERNTMSLADLAKGGNVALCLYRDNGMDRGLLLSMGKRVFEGPFDRAAAQYNALVRSWWARSFPGMQVPNEHLYVAKAGNAFKVGDKFYKAVSISPDDADQIRRLLDKPHATDVDEARITRFARKYGIRQEGGSSYNRKMLAAFLEQNGESSSKAARPEMRKAKSPADALLSPSAWKKSGEDEKAMVVAGDQTFSCTISQSGGWTGDSWVAEVRPLGNVSSKKSPEAMGSREQAVQWCIGYIQRMTKAAGAPMRKAGTDTWTCNVRGNVVADAKEAGYNAYFANGVTAIEIPASSKAEATQKARQFGTVLYVFI